MDHSSIQNYLARWKTKNILANALMAGGAFFAALIVLFLTFWVTYMVLFLSVLGVSVTLELAFNKHVYLAHNVRLMVSGAFLVLLFIEYFRTPAAYWRDLTHRTYPRMPESVEPPAALGELVALIVQPATSANAIKDFLMTGPRMLTGAWQFASRAARLRALDAASCSNVLAVLVERGSAVTYRELREAGWELSLEQLRSLEGVHFLEKGLSLSSELRTVLCGEKTV